MNTPKLRFKEFNSRYQNYTLENLLIEDIKNGTQNKPGLNEEKIKFINVINLYSPIIKHTDLTYVDKELKKIEHLLVEKGDLFYTRSSITVDGIAHCNIYNDSYSPVTFDDHIMRVRINKNWALPDYIRLYSTSQPARKYLMATAKTGTMTTIGQGELKKLRINLPIKEEQEKISNFFININKKIKLQQEKIDLLKEQKIGYMQKVFSQELRFKDDSGQEFPDWQNIFIKDVCEVGSCTRVHQKDWTSIGIPFFRARDIVSINKGEECEPLFISEETYKEKSSKSGIVKKGDVMITGVGTIGVPYLIQHDDPIYFKDGNVIWLKKSDKINGEFLYYTILSQEIQSFIKTTSGIGTVGTYTIDNAKKTPLKLPCIAEQHKIVLFLNKIYGKIKLENQKLQHLNAQKQAFMQQMFI